MQRGATLLLVVFLVAPIAVNTVLHVNHAGTVNSSGSTVSLQPASLAAFDTGARYYEYSGRVVVARGSDLPFLLGREPREVVFAYFDGMYWQPLPTRIYEEVVETNATRIYVLPERIGPDTIIEFKLPSRPSRATGVETVVPEFARGSTGHLLLVKSPRGGLITSLYVFVGGAVESHAWGYTVLNSYDFAGVAESFEALEPSTMLDALLGEGLGEAEAMNAVRNMAPLLVGRDVVVERETGFPVPDGGGGSNPYAYNLVEVRAQPWMTMVKHDYVLTRANSSFTKTLYVLDPSAPSSVKWTMLRLTIEAYREPARSVARYAVVAFNSECGSYTRVIRFYGDEKNIVHVDFTPNAYGATCKRVLFTLRVDGLASGEEWRVRVIPTVYVKWDYSGVSSDARTKKLYLDLLDTTLVKARIARGKSDTRIYYLSPATLHAFPVTGREATIAIRATSLYGPPAAYPVKITVSIAGIRQATGILYHRSSTTLTLRLDPDTLAALSSLHKPIPVLLRFETLNPSAPKTPVDIGVGLTSTTAAVTTRTMYTLYGARGEDPDSVIYTSTALPGSDIWQSIILFNTATLLSLASGDVGSSTSRVLSLTARLDRQGESELVPGPRAYQLVLDTSYPSHTLCYGGTCRGYLGDRLWKAVVKVSFPSTAVLRDAGARPSKFSLQGLVPSLPELPAPLSVMLDKLPVLGVLSEGYNVFGWMWNRVAQETANSIYVDLDPWSRRVVMTWTRGALSPNGVLSGTLLIDNVFYSRVPVQGAIRVDVKLYAEGTGVHTYVFTAKP